MAKSKFYPQDILGRQHSNEPHDSSISSRLNWLRAGVLGANDGIVSVAGLVVGVASATSSPTAIFVAGVASLVAGAFSMAGGEYVSVSSQRDSEKALLAKEKWELETMPEAELEELTLLYQKRGLSAHTASVVAKELTDKDAFAAHADIELNIDPDDLTNPWAAAFASFLAFTVGALLPLLAITLTPQPYNIAVCFIAVVVALLATGFISAKLGQASPLRAMVRNAGMGIITMVGTWLIGSIFDVNLS